MRVPTQSHAAARAPLASRGAAGPGFSWPCAALLSLLGCRAAPSAPAADLEAARLQELVEAGVASRLAELFPEARPPYSAESLRAALLGGALVAQGEEEQLIAWVRAGEYEKARESLARRLAQADWDAARLAVASGDARAALARYDLALERLPRERLLRLERAEQIAAVASLDGDAPLMADALAEFEAVLAGGSDVRAALGAARAASGCGAFERGVAHARAALAEAAASEPPKLAMARLVAADLCLRSARALRESGEGGRALERSEEGLALLRDALRGAPEDAWARRALVDELQVLARHAAARDEAIAGLAALGPDARLLAALATSARALSGRELLLSDLRALAARQPEWSALRHELGRALHEEGLEQLDLAREQDEAAARARLAFEEEEREFALAARDPALRADADAFRAVARCALGWLDLRAGELEAARRSFLSVQDLGLALLRVESPPLVPCAVAGLHALGARFAERAQDPLAKEALDALESAARIYAFLHESEPDVVDWANNAGFFQRDLAVALEFRAREMESKDDAAGAERLAARARETMEASWRSYKAAARLAPEDVRIRNDAGLVLAYYLQREVPLAKQMLLEAVELGEAQVRALEATLRGAESDEQRESARRRLEEVATALGDACQNLGVLCLTLEGDPRAAKEWLLRSLETGVDPREEVRGKGGFLERCQAAIDSGIDPRLRPEQRWAAPAALRATAKKKS
ncbi:MAG: hypothetical protein RL112_2050 [Planctomycetota bacterium]